MAIGKQFDEEKGYAASREIPAAVAQYMKATGKSEEQVAKEIINEDPEWLDWRTHTSQPGNSTPDDNGWTDLKKLGLGIANSWEDHRNNTDPMWRVGLVNAIFGDPSMLGQYYQMQNANEQAERNRILQNAYNEQIKSQSKAEEDALKNAQAEKTFRDTVAGLQDTGKELSNREKNMVMTAYNELSDVSKAKYSKTMEDLGLVTVEQTAPGASANEQSSVRKYKTELDQKYTKDEVQNRKAEIVMMENGPKKLAKAKELNQLILDNQANVEGGLGNGFSPEELKKFGTVAAKQPKKGDVIDAKTFKQWRDKIKVKAAGKGMYEVL